MRWVMPREYTPLDRPGSSTSDAVLGRTSGLPAGFLVPETPAPALAGASVAALRDRSRSPSAGPTDPRRKVYVSGLPSSVTEAQLRRDWGQAGDLAAVTLSGTSALLKYVSHGGAQAAHAE